MTPAPRTTGDLSDDLPEAPADRTLPQLLARNARAYGRLPALSWQSAGPDGDWTTLSWAEVYEHTRGLAAGYRALGVGRGDHVLLMMSNRPEHWLTDLALVRLGAVPVSVYGTAAPEQITHVARNCRARLAVVEGAAQVAVWEPLLTDAGTPLERLVVAEEDAAGGHVPYATLLHEPPQQPSGEAQSCGEARLSGRAQSSGGVQPSGEAHLPGELDTARPDDPLTVVYTSGTSGEPKGVVLTHRQVMSNALALDAVVELPPHVEHICYLPFAHIAERMLGIYLPCHRASHVHLCADPATVAAVVREVRPAQFFGVPRVWEKLSATVQGLLALMPAEQRTVIDQAFEVAREHVGYRERGESPPAELEKRYLRVREDVLLPMLAAGGLDRVTWSASASAPMPIDVVRFWAGFGVVIMDAWGLTETTGVATCNSPRSGFRLGSVGRPVESVEIRIAADGEILVRGPSVFSGYLQPDGSVRSALDADGWLATGDIGRLDEDGYLWLTDRKKEMIITSTGKNVSPALVENALKAHPLIGQAMVHGDNRSYLVALLVLDAEAAPAWAAANGVEGVAGGPAGLAALADHPVVRAEVDRAVAAANSRLSRSEQVKRYEVLAEEWGPATGELTPSLKMRRRVIRDKYADSLTRLYGT